MKQISTTVDHKSNHSPLAVLGTTLLKFRAFMASPIARRMVFTLFVLQAVFLVFTVRIGTPPDETNHVHFIQFYTNHTLSPIFDQQTPTYNLGDKTREVDYLYHYFMSLVARILPFSGDIEIKIIRLFSVGFGLLTFLTLARVLKLLGVTAGAITGALLVITNLPMVLMLSSAVNNDVMVWLGAVVGLLLLIRLWQKPTVLDLLWLANLSIAGGLVKRTFLPLGLVFGFLGVLVLVKNWQALVQTFRWRNIHVIVALLVLITSIALFTERVGGNVIRYGHIVASCDEVQGKTACYDFWDNARKRYLATLPPETPVPISEFVVRWFGESFANVVDIQTQGWRHEVKPARWLTPSLVWLLIIGIVYGVVSDSRRFMVDQLARWRLYVLSISLFFVLVQLLVNLGNYRQYQVFGIALNGRYILPTLIPLIGLAWLYWSKLLGRYPKVQVLLAVAVVVFTILGSGLLMMVHNPQLRLG